MRPLPRATTVAAGSPSDCLATARIMRLYYHDDCIVLRIHCIATDDVGYGNLIWGSLDAYAGSRKSGQVWLRTGDPRSTPTDTNPVIYDNDVYDDRFDNDLTIVMATPRGESACSNIVQVEILR